MRPSDPESLETCEDGRFERHAWSLRFKCPDTESAYLVHHYQAMMPTLRIVAKSFWLFTLYCTATGIVGADVLQISYFIHTASDASRILRGERVGTNLKPLGCLSFIAYVLHSKRITPANYQRCIVLCTIAFVVIFTADAPDNRYAIADTPISDVPLLVQEIAKHCAWHVTGSGLFMIGLACLLGLEPLPAVFAMSVCGFFLHHRSDRMLMQSFGVHLPNALVMHGIPSVLLIFSCYIQASLMRRDFLTSAMLSATKNRRIEQIQREKERLDYERNMLLHTVQRASSIGFGEYDSEPSVASCDHPSGRARVNGEATTGGSSPRGERHRSQNRVVNQRCGPRSGGSTVSSAAEELAAHPARDKSDPSCGMNLTRQANLNMLQLFKLLPNYYGEILAYGQPRSSRDGNGGRLQLRVDPHTGLLIDADGIALPSTGGAEPKLFNFVMDLHAQLWLAHDVETGPGQIGQRYHHSCMVSGEPVLAAGQMLVQVGRILTISNESGHYMPPPSCLRTVLARLSELGVGSLSEVSLECVQTPQTQGISTSSDVPTPPSRLQEPVPKRAAVSPRRPRSEITEELRHRRAAPFYES